MLATQAKIRRARLEDLAKVARLEQRVWTQMGVSDSLIRRRFFLYPQGFQVALIGREIAGFCCATLTDQNACIAKLDEYFPPHHVPRGSFFFLFGLTVNPVYRRNGIGTRLVTQEILEAQRSGCLRIQLIANRHSRELFRKLGFSCCQKLPQLYSRFPGQMPEPVLLERALATETPTAGETTPLT